MCAAEIALKKRRPRGLVRTGARSGVCFDVWVRRLFVKAVSFRKSQTKLLTSTLAVLVRNLSVIID